MHTARTRILYDPSPNPKALNCQSQSLKRSNIEENTELLIQGAETAVATVNIESQHDIGLELENGIADLRGTLKTIVDVIVDKMDILAEVRKTIHGL